MNRSSRFQVSLALTCALTGMVQAQFQWRGGSGGTPDSPRNGNWSSNNHWQGSSAPTSGPGRSLIFSRTIFANGYEANQNSTNPFDLSELVLRTLDLSGQPRNFDSISAQGIRFVQFPGHSPPICSISGNGQFNISTGVEVQNTMSLSCLESSTLQFERPITLNANLTIVGDLAAKVRLGTLASSVPISGPGSLILDGAYSSNAASVADAALSVSLRGSSTFSGGLDVRSAALTLQNDSTLATAPAVAFGPVGTSMLTLRTASLLAELPADGTRTLHNPVRFNGTTKFVGDPFPVIPNDPIERTRTFHFAGAAELDAGDNRLLIAGTSQNAVRFSSRLTERAGAPSPANFQFRGIADGGKPSLASLTLELGAQLRGNFVVTSGLVQCNADLGAPASKMNLFQLDPEQSANACEHFVVFAGRGTIHALQRFDIGAGALVKLSSGGPSSLTFTAPADFAPGSGLEFLIDGTSPGNGPGFHSQLTVQGDVAVNGSLLRVSLLSPPTTGHAYVLLRNNSDSSIAGRFAFPGDNSPMPEGTVFSLPIAEQFYSFRINYFGGDGNDLAITCLGPDSFIPGPLIYALPGDENAINARTAGASTRVVYDDVQILRPPGICGPVLVDAACFGTLQVGAPTNSNVRVRLSFFDTHLGFTQSPPWDPASFLGSVEYALENFLIADTFRYYINPLPFPNGVRIQLPDSDLGVRMELLDYANPALFHGSAVPLIIGVDSPSVGTSDPQRCADANNDGILVPSELLGTAADRRSVYLRLRAVNTPLPSVPCVADTDDGASSGIPDGGVTIDDLLFYLLAFESGQPRADIDDGTATATPDGGVTIDDLLFYLLRFEAGC